MSTSNLAAKLRKLYGEAPTDSTAALEQHDSLLDAPSLKKRKVDASLLNLGGNDQKTSSKGRLRLRADIPNLVPSAKVSRRELEQDDGMLSSADEQSSSAELEFVSGDEVEGGEDGTSSEDDLQEKGSSSELEDNDFKSEASEISSDDAPIEQKTTSHGAQAVAPRGGIKHGAEEEDDQSDKKRQPLFAINADLQKQYEEATKPKKFTLIKKIGDSTVNSGEKFAPQAVRTQVNFFKKLQKLRILLEPSLKRVRDAGVGATNKASEIERQKSQHDQLLKLKSELQQLQVSSLPEEWQVGRAELQATSNNATSQTKAVLPRLPEVEQVVTSCVDALEQTRQETQVTVKGEKAFKVLDQSIPAQIRNALLDKNWEKKVHPKKAAEDRTSAASTTPATGTTSALKNQDEDLLDRRFYDDRDFYAQMLQDIVSAGCTATKGDDTSGRNLITSAATESANSKSKALNSKKNLHYDRRASKGRKIRYVPIEKLQNFMTARSVVEQMNDTLVEQMMRSLFR
ncbi:unnamed protein product [Amoebophrya sp. A120]|nr:unnamed protein product [Amoebophrya sp. A120]|eukprot:GSA120T00021499001.1